MAASPPPRGLIIDVITPLMRGNKIDGRGLGRLLDRGIPYAQALFIGSPYAGNGKTLDMDGREDLFEKALVVVRGRVPILVWISCETEEKTVDTLLSLSKRMKLRNYSGAIYWVDTPLYYHSNRGLPAHYARLSLLVEESFILHNDPELIKAMDRPLKRNNIRTNILKEISRMERIGGLIFSGSLDRVQNYAKAVRSRTDFRIYDGDESRFLEYPSLSGVLSMGANLAPRAWQKITASSLDLNGGNKDYPDHLKQIWYTGGYVKDLRHIYWKHGPPILKYVLSDMEVISGSTESHAAKQMEAERRSLRSLMEQYGDYS